MTVLGTTPGGENDAWRCPPEGGRATSAQRIARFAINARCAGKRNERENPVRHDGHGREGGETGSAGLTAAAHSAGRSVTSATTQAGAAHVVRTSPTYWRLGIKDE